MLALPNKKRKNFPHFVLKGRAFRLRDYKWLS